MEKLKRSIIKEELVAITGDFIKAIILNQFIYWLEKMKDFDLYIEQENKRRTNNGLTEENVKTNGWVYKTAEELIKETMINISISTMRNYVKEIVAMGFLDERTNPDYKWDKTKQYRVNLVKIAEEMQKLGYQLQEYRFTENEIRISKIENREEQNQNAIPNITTNITTNNKENSSIINNTPKREQQILGHKEQELLQSGHKGDICPPKIEKEQVLDQKEVLFNDFWKMYPRKDDKKRAKQIFLKIKNIEQVFPIILNSLEKDIKSNQWQNKQFIPMPSTWLGRERWEDEGTTTRQDQLQTIDMSAFGF